MNREIIIGIIRLSLAHHPVCWQYRNHTIKIFNVKFCLGCFAFYSGFIASILIIFFTPLFTKLNWSELILLSTLLYLPTILRIVKTPFFSSKKKNLRFLFRFLLGFGIGTGLLSIFSINILIIQITQVILGVLLYAGLSIQRILDKDSFKECETCSFTRSNTCPGFKPFRPSKTDIQLSHVFLSTIK